jgi:hypothetical protein
VARLFDDASTQYLEVDSTPLTQVPATLACWFRSDDITLTQALISLADKDDDNDRLTLFAGGGTAGDPVIAQTTNQLGSTAAAVSSTGYSADVWHHACGVFAANNDRRAFIDGGSKGTNTTTRSMVSGQIDRVSIGRLGSLTVGNYMSGRIAQAAIWNVALSDAEVAALARGIAPPYIQPAALIAYWPAWGTHSPEIDLTTGNRQLVVSGAVSANHAPVSPFSSRLWGSCPFIEEGTPPGGGTGQPMWRRVGHIVVPSGVRFGRGY